MTQVEDSSDEDEGAQEVPHAIWDASDRVSRCTECNFEVVDGICEGCRTIHQVDVRPLQL